MTPSSNNLEDLRLLREAPLPLGFEERLQVRLAAAAADKQVLRLGSRRRYHGLLLLAAIALPVAAFAAGGVLIAQHFSEPKKPAATAVEVKSVPVAANKPVFAPSVAPAQAPSVPAIPRSEESPKKVNATGPVKVTPSKVAPVKAAPVQVIPEKVEAAPANVERAPAKIESLDLNLPVRRGATSSSAPSESGTASSSALRGATAKGNANRVGADGADSGQKREQAGERRGSDAAAQAKERVQARERKGQ